MGTYDILHDRFTISNECGPNKVLEIVRNFKIFLETTFSRISDRAELKLESSSLVVLVTQYL